MAIVSCRSVLYVDYGCILQNGTKEADDTAICFSNMLRVINGVLSTAKCYELDRESQKKKGLGKLLTRADTQRR